MMMGGPHGDVIDLMTHYSSSCYNYSFTSLASITDYLYSLMFGNGNYGNSWISCSTSLLGGNPLVSEKTSIYAYKNSFSHFLYFLVHPSKDAFPLIESSTDGCSLKNSKTYFLLELINFLAWCALINKILTCFCAC